MSIKIVKTPEQRRLEARQKAGLAIRNFVIVVAVLSFIALAYFHYKPSLIVILGIIPIVLVVLWGLVFAIAKYRAAQREKGYELNRIERDKETRQSISEWREISKHLPPIGEVIRVSRSYRTESQRDARHSVGIFLDRTSLLAMYKKRTPKSKSKPTQVADLSRPSDLEALSGEQLKNESSKYWGQVDLDFLKWLEQEPEVKGSFELPEAWKKHYWSSFEELVTMCLYEGLGETYCGVCNKTYRNLKLLATKQSTGIVRIDSHKFKCPSGHMLSDYTCLDTKLLEYSQTEQAMSSEEYREAVGSELKKTARLKDFNELLRKIKQNDIAAKVRYGRMFMGGIELDKEIAEAVLRKPALAETFLRQASESGNTDAKFYLAEALDFGFFRKKEEAPDVYILEEALELYYQVLDATVSDTERADNLRVAIAYFFVEGRGGLIPDIDVAVKKYSGASDDDAVREQDGYVEATIAQICYLRASRRRKVTGARVLNLGKGTKWVDVVGALAGKYGGAGHGDAIVQDGEVIDFNYLDSDDGIVDEQNFTMDTRAGEVIGELEDGSIRYRVNFSKNRICLFPLLEDGSVGELEDDDYTAMEWILRAEAAGHKRVTFLKEIYGKLMPPVPDDVEEID